MYYEQESQPVHSVRSLLPEPAFLPLSRRRRHHYVLCVLAFVVVGAFALFTLAASLLLWLAAKRSWDYREARRWICAGAIIGGAVYVTWLWQASLLPLFWHSLITDLSRHLWQASCALIVHLWFFNLLLTPTFALLPATININRSRSASRSSFKGGFLADYEAAARSEQATETQMLETFQAIIMNRDPHLPLPSSLRSPAVERLGSYEGGELVEWVRAGQFCLSPELLRLHGVLIGEPNYGKTTTLIRLLAVARCYGRKVIYLDLKGSRTTAAHFLAAMKVLRVKHVKMYPREAYDGWRGDS